MSASHGLLHSEAPAVELPQLTLVADAALPRPASEIGEALRRANRAAMPALFALVVLGWLWFAMPQALGGRAGWVLVDGTSMLPRYHTGDLVLVERQSQYHVGEVIAYRVPKGDAMAGAQVIHRIVAGNGTKGFVVQGDNRTAPDVWHPKTSDIIGAKLLRVPDAWFVLKWLRSPLLLGLLAAAIVFAKVLGGKGGEGEGDSTEP
ncbi:MAG: signal peptidase I [Gaiellaceae bacterium]